MVRNGSTNRSLALRKLRVSRLLRGHFLNDIRAGSFSEQIMMTATLTWQQPGDGDVQRFRKDKEFKIAHAAEADFNLGNADSVDVRSQTCDTICQLLLCEPRPRPQPRFADARADDVLMHVLKSPPADFAYWLPRLHPLPTNCWHRVERARMTLPGLCSGNRSQTTFCALAMRLLAMKRSVCRASAANSRTNRRESVSLNRI